MNVSDIIRLSKPAVKKQKICNLTCYTECYVRIVPARLWCFFFLDPCRIVILKFYSHFSVFFFYRILCYCLCGRIIDILMSFYLTLQSVNLGLYKNVLKSHEQNCIASMSSLTLTVSISFPRDRLSTVYWSYKQKICF